MSHINGSIQNSESGSDKLQPLTISARLLDIPESSVASSSAAGFKAVDPKNLELDQFQPNRNH